MKKPNPSLLLLLGTLSLGCSFFAFAQDENRVSVRIKDLVEMRGVRSNALEGFGLVIGLPGSGDSKQSLATNKSVSHLISRLGVNVAANEVTTKNVAAVVVTAELPPFARIGDKINIRISSIGDASSLEGGSLVLTPLSGADGKIYGIAQGSISLGNGMAGAMGGKGQGASSAPKTVALAGGATVEMEFEQTYIRNGNLELSLKNSDFTTATRVAKAINENFHEFLADAVNSTLVKVKVPKSARSESFNPVNFVSAVEQIRVEPDNRAVVIVNERTGTIVSGFEVVISPVSISHGTLEVVIGGEGEKSEKDKDAIKKMVGSIPASTTVGELVQALNSLGAGPRDLVAIMQALEAAKALKAELKFM